MNTQTRILRRQLNLVTHAIYHLRNNLTMSLYSLAKACGVSKSTLVRAIEATKSELRHNPEFWEYAIGEQGTYYHAVLEIRQNAYTHRGLSVTVVDLFHETVPSDEVKHAFRVPF